MYSEPAGSAVRASPERSSARSLPASEKRLLSAPAAAAAQMAPSCSYLFPWLLLCALAVSLVCPKSVLGSTANAIETPDSTNLPGNRSLLEEAELHSGLDFEDDETDEDDLVSELDGSVRTQPVVKPENTTKKGERKNSDKKRRRQGKNKGQKKQKLENPCNTTHQEYCFHGRCRYLEPLDKVACICDYNYVGERCSDIYMKTKSFSDLSDTSTTALAVVAVLLSTVSFIAIAIVIVVHMRKKYSTTYEGETEEKTKLGHDNGDVDV